MSTLESTLQQQSTGAKIDLFRIDTSKVGGGEYFFLKGSKDDSVVKFGGLTYYPVDIEVSGFEVNAGGELPTPTIRISNTDQMVQAIVNAYGDLLGCRGQRIRTFEQYLDGKPTADPSAVLGPDTFDIERKVDENADYIEWELSASIDQEGKMLPGRVVIRDTCMWRYRAWNKATGRFDYSKAQCPYTGAQSYDRNNLPTTSDKDEPSRRMSCCETRFGKNAAFPFGAFPGSARVRG